MTTSGDEAPRLVVDVKERCARVTLDRPEKLNALDTRAYRELEATAAELAARRDVAVVTLTGAGRAFCAGADLEGFARDVDVEDAHAVRSYLRWVGGVVKAWATLEKPTIAAVNGLAVGGGCNLALMCDLVLMHEDASIAQAYAPRGLVPDMGGTYFLPRLVGRARAFELAYFGDALSAEEAVAAGLANRAVPAAEWEPTLESWARRLAETPGRALGLIKAGLLASPLLDLDAMLEWEANAIALVFATDDVRESLAAFRERRPPLYTGR
jgi:2-(1,2-epoxy-1,2-dihydrophenyl)acetyl-CoA isomerase